MNFSEAEQQLLAQVEAADQKMRRDLVAAVLASGVLIRAPHQKRANARGWLQAMGADELNTRGYSISSAELAYPVPATCPWWHNAEFDPRDQSVLRFFGRKAWAHTAAPQGHTLLEITLHFWLNQEATASFYLSSPDVPVRRLARHQDEHGRIVLTYEREGSEAQTFRLVFGCEHFSRVDALYEGAADTRFLSVGVGVPRWLAAPATQAE